MDLKPYKPSEGGGFIKLKERLKEVGDSLELQLINGEVQEGNFGPQLVMKVKLDGEEKLLSCDAPHEGNDMSGSQIYRGIYDNDIKEGDTFLITHGGRMNNKYKTVIYTVSKDETPPPPEEEPEVDPDSIPF